MNKTPFPGGFSFGFCIDIAVLSLSHNFSLLRDTEKYKQ